MGLMEGLSNWLRQIIAVVLLASLIDLLLPNRTMQRYVRLVAGLFILMTVATPILHWMKGDFSSKLADGLSAVELTPDSADRQMAMIEEEGAKLRDKHGAQAADLVSMKLAAAIRSEVEQSEQREVRKVDVELERGSDGALSVAKVAVLLEPEPTSSAVPPAPSENIEPIAAVEIRIEIEDWPEKEEPGTEGEQTVFAEPQEMETDRETRLRISALVASRFGLSANIVEVKLLTSGAPE
ncbi:stage III sporulation protein AF [Cohnella luojiensis]|uniref:Stage III sporulation protein AF n=1 Tax=Cohnella luojiensis TaxID=652876 RepID=A0A4Y8M5S8_9BACL|nr:stage III sporulation protein AF [Cohnella luojiensis]TFE29890.1 stage III sporulation protein AF [Cohnella luojiensis]